MAQIGTVTPNEWMRQAVGAPLSATPLVQAAEKALRGSMELVIACASYGRSGTRLVLAR